ncbi:MAG: flavodoxin-dependent (E)-4-hydroxy-3-methylbut-2-enyl-diphosphate synthase [Candidatus Beckwithbacteria bacterium]|nr:flavodoxin-dependent (E)-4-hydroxy-3-methylbut-2-enyl-diphosphate synthase [Candidatus Beckwithbacteria bacterium]
MKRKLTKKIRVGKIAIGGDSPVTVQTMVKVDAHDIRAVVRQIREQEEVGCDITRMNVLDMESVKNFSKIKKEIHIPIVADIHLNYEWALEAIRQGVDKLRINPGNIGGIDKVKKVVKLAKERGVPIRIGVNAGSLERDLLLKFGRPTPEALVESAGRHIQILEDLNFDQIVVSLKASDVIQMTQAYQLFSQKYDYPIHLGVTEAGPPSIGIIVSSMGIGSLLLEGIGDTIRVSLSGDSLEEIRVGKEILKNLALRSGPRLISCPTCSRTQYNMLPLVAKVEKYLQTVKKPIRVAVMGCVVNGPGEAREADVGIAGGKNAGALFAKGKVIKPVKEKEMFEELVNYIEKIY